MFEVITKIVMIGCPIVLFCIVAFAIKHLLSTKETKGCVLCILSWLFLPILLPYFSKKYGMIKSRKKLWTLVFISPFFVFFILLVLLFLALAEPDYPAVPEVAKYHNAQELQQATGVEFPEVILVDSLNMFASGFYKAEEEMFIPRKPLTKEFYGKLDKACKEDSCCWKKEENGYRYNIYPELPLDRTKGSHRRMVDEGGKMVPDWQGDFVEVWVPFSGDTITIRDGWHN